MHIRVALISLVLLLTQSPSPAPRDVTASSFHYSTIAPIQVSLEELPELSVVPYPVEAPATFPNAYEWGNCTWYVAGRIRVPNTWGNADTWALRAAADGYTVSSVPIIGSIAVSTAGYYGHVAIVSAINDNSVRIDEMNSVGLGVASERWVSTSSYVYIYI